MRLPCLDADYISRHASTSKLRNRNTSTPTKSTYGVFFVGATSVSSILIERLKLFMKGHRGFAIWIPSICLEDQ